MGNAFILVVVGLLLMYAVLSDKFFCLEACANCLAGRTGTDTDTLKGMQAPAAWSITQNGGLVVPGMGGTVK